MRLSDAMRTSMLASPRSCPCCCGVPPPGSCCCRSLFSDVKLPLRPRPSICTCSFSSDDHESRLSICWPTRCATCMKCARHSICSRWLMAAASSGDR